MPLPTNLPEPERTITLRRPLEVKGGKVTELRLREPTAQEAFRAEGHIQFSTHSEAVTLYIREMVSAVTSISTEVLDHVPISELATAGAYFTGFTDAGLEGLGEDTADRPDEWEIELPTELSYQGVQYATLRLSEPTTGGVRKAQGQLRKGVGPQSMRAYQMWLVANASGVPFQVIQQLPVSTLNAAATYVQGFIEPGRATGRT
ncbi:phage tail assembly protein [Roseomonas elaeocarpi]|uniref:Phage tail assembly protein n=1 Tax=Roseomonas elaeocarpi TaxID=907779 RepID=A0ABV6JQB9_9PROT